MDSPLARHWARLHAQRLASEDAEVEIVSSRAEVSDPGREVRVLAVSAGDFADGRALPVPPGPFGGTTVVVVGPEASDEQRDAWRLLATSDVMQEAHGRFYRLRVAFLDGEPTLHDGLERLRDQGRSNVLIVPAVFCAGAQAMRHLREGVRDLEDAMTLTWLPGLGGSLAEVD